MRICSSFGLRWRGLRAFRRACSRSLRPADGPAVADVTRDLPSGTAPGAGGGEAAPGDITEHALFAEVVELSQWCHGLRDV